jgi:hypothetical protein
VDLHLEFFGIIKLFKFLCFLTLLLTFTAFSLLISFLAFFNSCLRCLILHSCCFVCFWYIQDIQSHGMLLSAKLGLVTAQFVWKQLPQLLQFTQFVTHLRQAAYFPVRLPVSSLQYFNHYTTVLISLMSIHVCNYFTLCHSQKHNTITNNLNSHVLHSYSNTER